MKEVQLIFGYHACVGALKNLNRKIISMKCTEDFYVKHKNLIENRKIKDFEIVNRRIIDNICKNNFHQGVFINCGKLNKNHLDEIHNDENIIFVTDNIGYIYAFDIDGTICSNTNGNYQKAIPFENRIMVINNLYDTGNTIKMFTARGTTTNIDWYDFTKRQLDKWGLKYHELITGKPEADYFIDDSTL